MQGKFNCSGWKGTSLHLLKYQKPDLFSAPRSPPSQGAKSSAPGFKEYCYGWLFNAELGELLEEATGDRYSHDGSKLYRVHQGGSWGDSLLDVRADAVAFTPGAPPGQPAGKVPAAKAPAAKGPGAKAPAARAAAAPAPVPSRSRRLLIGDLHRVAAALKLDLSHHDRPSALFAVFDAQEGRAAAGEAASKALHTQLLPRLAGHRGQWTSEEVREALAASLGDALAASEGGGEGVAAVAALLLGPRLVVATWGGARHSLLAPQRQATELQALVAGAEGGAAAQPSAPEVAKKPGAHASGSEPSGRITPLPKVLPLLPGHMLAQRGSASASSVQAVVVDLDFGGRFQTLALLARAEQPEDVLPEAEIAAVAGQVTSSHRPRAGCRALIQSARSCGVQGSFIVCLVNFLWAAPVDSSGAPRAKRPRIEVQDKVRVRHILLRHAASTAPMDKVRRKKVTRSLEDAEELMFEVLGELEADPSHFTAVCREISECQSCLKGGELAGDIGWLSREKPLANMPEVSKASFALSVGELSDLIISKEGVHLLMRTA